MLLLNAALVAAFRAAPIEAECTDAQFKADQKLVAEAAAKRIAKMEPVPDCQWLPIVKLVNDEDRSHDLRGVKA